MQNLFIDEINHINGIIVSDPILPNLDFICPAVDMLAIWTQFSIVMSLDMLIICQISSTVSIFRFFSSSASSGSISLFMTISVSLDSKTTSIWMNSFVKFP